MWRKLLSLVRTPPASEHAQESQIIAPWLAPADWECEGPFDTPRHGPGVPSFRTLTTDAIAGRHIRMASTNVGSYGMGGSGFLGLALDASETRPAEWLVLCLWGAAEWCLWDGVPIRANEKSGMYEVGTTQFENVISGTQLIAACVEDRSCQFCIARAVSGAISTLEVPSDTSRLPVYGVSGGRRKLGTEDSLLDAWVLSPSNSLYV